MIEKVLTQHITSCISRVDECERKVKQQNIQSNQHTVS